MRGLFGRLVRPEPQEGLKPDDLRFMDYLRRNGADLSQPRETRHWLYFPNQKAAEAAGRRLAQVGYTVDVEPSPQKAGGEWRVLATGMDVVSREVFPGVRQLMEELAARGEGAYDGWEASPKP